MDQSPPGRLRVCLLGTVRAWSGPTPCPLGPPQRRAVFAVLALAAGQPVSRSELVNMLWPDAPPARAANVIQTHVKHLRQALEPDRSRRAASAVLPAIGSGYALRIEPSAVDALRFRDLVATAREARRAGEVTRLWQLARSATALWDTPVVDLPALAAHPRVAALVAEWQLLVGWYAEVATAQGRADEVVPILEEQARLRPLDEPVQVLLIRAYAALGRRSDAFAVYANVRRRLVAELGVDAGQELRSAYDELLHDHETPAAQPTRPADDPPNPPAQLPALVHDFVGRDAELADLDRAPAGADRADLVAIVGPPGVGKTALGLTWAHRMADRFPDGQLYVDLRGFGADAPLRPAVVLERFLRALGVAQPADPEELAAQFRTHLASRRIVVFLDNAASTEQIQPLLPGQGASLAIVTSRQRLDGLVALHGARRISLGPLARPDAIDLIRRLTPAAGGSGPATEVLTDLAEMCDRLPLAVRIACSRLDPLAGFGIATLASTMADERTRLDELATESGEISVRAVFATSMRALDPAAQRLLRLLSDHPGPRPSLAAGAAMGDLLPAAAQPVVAQLVAAHLLAPAGPAQFAMHDLVRLIAHEDARALPPAERDGAMRRLLAWYRDTADSADSQLRPGERPNFAAPPRPDAFPDEAGAHAWLDQEAANLVAAVEYAAGPYPREAWQIAAAMFGWLNRSHNRAQWVALYTIAVDAAERAGDASGEAMIAARLAVAYSQQGLTAEAVAACERAYRIRCGLGDPLGAASALLNLGAVYLDHGKPEPAIQWLHRAATQLDDAGVEAGHFRMLLHSNLGEAHRLMRRFAAAARHYHVALEIGLATGKNHDSAQILVELSRLCLDTADAPGALMYAHRALDHAGQARDVVMRAEAQECAGRALLIQGDLAAARNALTAALTAYENMGHRNIGPVRALVNAGVNQSRGC
jgi:DNA-binding SARP family transcriptional activator/tetratricopeptide (TPR) repeat protein